MNTLPLRLRWRRVGRAALTATAAVSLALVPVATAHAQVDCLVVDYQAATWSAGADSGGFVAAITITNGCGDPIDGWTLALALPPGHTFTHGWSANWSSSGDQLTATQLSWNRVLHPGVPATIGFAGTWTGTYQDPPSCMINGRSCDGAQGGNEPPEAFLTRPGGGLAGILSPCPFILAADASDPDGAIDRVEFYVNNVPVGTDRTAPYLIGIGYLPTAAPPSSEYVALARAYDDGVPQLSSDSEPVTFQVVIGDPPPETIFECMSSLELPAGGSEEIRFALFSSTADQVTLTVTGDPAVTVSPTTVVPSGNPGLGDRERRPWQHRRDGHYHRRRRGSPPRLDVGHRLVRPA